MTYDVEPVKGHKLTLTGVTSWNKGQSDNNNMRASGQPLDSYLFHNMASGITKYGVQSKYSQTQKMSYALRFNYVYKDKYIASLPRVGTVRHIWQKGINGRHFRQVPWHGVFRRNRS